MIDDANSRRTFLTAAAAAALAATPLAGDAAAQGNGSPPVLAAVNGSEHWTSKRAGNESIRLFLWRKQLATAGPRRGTILFVHGSSVSATPVFDLQISGKPEASTMDWFARLGYDTWCVDCEGYGRSDKSRPVNADVACGADDVAAASDYIMKQNGGQPLMLYGASSGALRAGLFAQRHPDMVKIGLSEVELMSGDAEAIAGAPAANSRGSTEMKAWRATATPATFQAVKKKFSAAGYTIL